MEKKTVKKAAPAAAKKPVKKAVTAAKPAAKKATATAKKAATVAKPAAKKAEVKKPAVKKAEVKKPAVKKAAAPAKKAVAAKPAVKKAAAPVKKAVAAKKPMPEVEKTRYSAEELQEFKELILSKIAKAEKDLEFLQQAVAGSENDVSDTAPTFKTLEEGSNVLLKEENQKLAARQQKFIRDLRAALIRIENGTYGICQATGKLIPKERLMIVPHATMTVEAKEASKKRR